MKLSAQKLSFVLLAVPFLMTGSINAFAADAPSAEKAAEHTGQNPGKQAINVHKAAFTLISNSFKPLGAAAQGKIEYNQIDFQKRANRILVLTDFLETSFPETANLGEPDTQAKAEVWTNRAEFDKKLKNLQEDAATLVKVIGSEKSASDAFKEATGAVAKDCKSCHEKFKAK
jgi:cytochrome c556